jgi:hypothetical protein
LNLSGPPDVQLHVMMPSRSYRFHFPPSQPLRAVQLRRPDTVVWLGTLALVVILFVIFFLA